MKKVVFGLLFLVFIISSCSISAYYTQSGAKTYPETSIDMIKIFSNDVDESYTVIGSIAVDAVGDAKSAEKVLKKKAASLGADAIIFCKLTKMTSVAQRTGLSGVAIKYN
ncbi:MAG: hypothetical protein JXB34_04005 [Bacteroidales bacterium]|nr:hypothetical protein [Bacteroidales bacterium]